VDLVDISSSNVLHTFTTERMQQESARYVCSPRWVAYNTGQVALSSLTLAYIHTDTKECILQTYLPHQAGGAISLDSNSPHDRDDLCKWNEARQVKRRIVNPGAWELLSPGCALGVRRTATFVGESRPAILGGTGLRQRSRGPEAKSRSRDTFEVWMIRDLENEEDDVETQPLEDQSMIGGQAGHLLISDLGPVLKIGTRSLGVALGNVVKVLSVGQERFDLPADDGLAAENLLSFSNRRRRIGLSRGGSYHGAPSYSPAPRPT
jgi:hypothetical protein